MVLTASILKRKYSDYLNPLDKIKREVDRGPLISLSRWLYEISKTVNPYLLATLYKKTNLKFINKINW